MALTNAEIAAQKLHRQQMANNPGVHPLMREYISGLESNLGPDGSDVLMTTTTSTTTTTTSSSSSTTSTTN